MSREEFFKHFNQICNISLFTVHSSMMSKLQFSNEGFENISTKISLDYKNFNVRLSSRKNLCIKNDSLINKVDIHTMFKESLRVKYN